MYVWARTARAVMYDLVYMALTCLPYSLSLSVSLSLCLSLLLLLLLCSLPSLSTFPLFCPPHPPPIDIDRYVALHGIRGFVITLFSPILRNLGYGLTWKEGFIMMFGGLRGAVGLALALLVDGEAGIPGGKEERGKRREVGGGERG
jgi:NhaP-type Na+/H+ or K+/H+ antiporter